MHKIKSDKGKYDSVILDPPRSGIHPKIAEYLLEYEPKKIIYVSCNPTTQARDLKLLAEKYEITKIRPVDMFPHTFHIENVVRLDLRK
jgi:23S rRNA (uracil1939-C5)-methyltransferase